MFNSATHSQSTLSFSLFPLCVSSLQYYDPDIFPYMKDQKNFEQNVFNKTHKADSESPPVRSHAPSAPPSRVAVFPLSLVFRIGMHTRVENLAPTSEHAVSSASSSRPRRNFPFLLLFFPHKCLRLPRRDFQAK